MTPAVPAAVPAAGSPDGTADGTADAAARRALAGRRELALLEQASVQAAARLLARHCRHPDPWVRAAVATLDRFRREVADGDLAGLLAAGRADPAEADRSLRRLAARHDGLTGSQLASLAFGPRIWWAAAGVRVRQPPPAAPPAAAPGSRPLPGRSTDADLRLLLLAVIGTGATEAELLRVRVRDAGRLDAAGEVVPDLHAEPLAVAYRAEDGGARHVTFLSHDARAALHERLAARGEPGPDEPLLLPDERAPAASGAARSAAAALIGAGNDVNVALCRATGDFFRAWGMPGARFGSRTPIPEEQA